MFVAWYNVCCRWTLISFFVLVYCVYGSVIFLWIFLFDVVWVVKLVIIVDSFCDFIEYKLFQLFSTCITGSVLIFSWLISVFRGSSEQSGKVIIDFDLTKSYFSLATRPSQIACMVVTMHIMCGQSMLHVRKNLCTVLIPLSKNNLNLPLLHTDHSASRKWEQLLPQHF